MSKKILHIYSDNPNIGNYIPIYGIQNLLKYKTTPVGVRKLGGVNFNGFDCAIVGGAGLLHKNFYRYWKIIEENCHIPIIIWGVGVCLNDSQKTEFNNDIFPKMSSRILAVNVRDELSSQLFTSAGIPVSSVTPCPSIIYAKQFIGEGDEKRINQILYSHHTELSNNTERHRIKEKITNAGFLYTTTNNICSGNLSPIPSSLKNIMLKYNAANTIISTRLHGAIIGYGMGKRVICIAHDEKIRAFCDMVGIKYVNTVDKLDLTDDTIFNTPVPQTDYASVTHFADTINQLIGTI